MKISFINKTKTTITPELKKDLRKVIREISISESKKISSLNLILCEDAEIREYNKKYLGHDHETDIITFYDKDENGDTEGELLMSLETIFSNSIRFRTDKWKELKRVVIHGVLHLCGYDDKTKKEKAIMKKRENHYLTK